jgi:hypothetical protein
MPHNGAAVKLSASWLSISPPVSPELFLRFPLPCGTMPDIREENVDANLELALQALERGDQHTARGLLRVVLLADPDNELAWLWLAEVAGTEHERSACLLQAGRLSARDESARWAAGLLQGRVETGVSTLSRASPEPAPGVAPGDVPVSHSVALRLGSGQALRQDSGQALREPAEGEVAVSHSVRVESSAAARHTVAEASRPPPPVTGPTRRPGWVQKIADLFAAVLGDRTEQR